MNTEFKAGYKKYIIYILTAAAAVIGVMNFDKVIAALGAFADIISPLVLGCVMAYILNIIMRRLEKIYFPKSDNKIISASRRPVCLIMSLLLIFIIIGLICVIIIPEISNIIEVFKSTIPYYIEKIKKLLINHQNDIPILQNYIQQFVNNPDLNWQGIISSVVDFAYTGVGGFISSTVTVVSAIFGGTVNFVIALIFAIYVLYNKEKLAVQAGRLMKSYLKEKTEKNIRYVCDTADKCFSSFIVGQCTEAIILGLLCVLGMMILKIPYATTVGTLVGVTALVPIVGAYIGAAAGTLMIIVVDPVKALWFLIFLIILQQVEGNVIYPKVVGSSVGLPGMWVLAAVTVGGGVGGIMGMLIGVPLTATVYKLISNDVDKKMAVNDKNTAENAKKTTLTDDTPAAGDLPPKPEKAPVKNESASADRSSQGKPSGKKKRR